MKLSRSRVEAKMGHCVTFSLYLRPHRNTTLKCSIRERDFLTHLTQGQLYVQRLCHLFFGMLTQGGVVSGVSPFLQQDNKIAGNAVSGVSPFCNRFFVFTEKD